MPETAGAVAAYFGGTAGAVGAGAGVAEATAAGVDVGLAAGGVGAGATGVAAAGTVGSGVAAGTVAGVTYGQLATSAATGIAGAATSALLAPKAPGVQQPNAMPDPAEQERARQRSITEQLARRGRASTVLTDSAPSGTLGG